MLCCVALGLAGSAQFLPAAPSDPLSHTLTATDATAAWAELHEALTPPPIPPAWKITAPTKDERAKFYLPFVTALQDKAKDFYTRFPKDEHVLDARKHEFEITQVAVQLGDTSQQPRLATEEKSLLADPALTEDDRFDIRRGDVERLAEAKQSEGEEAALAAFEKGTRELQKEFPTNAVVAQMLVVVARNSDAPKARAILQEVSKGDASEELKSEVAGQLKQLDGVGKPLELQFTAVDGREVDVAKMKGKVVLVDFWATWCGPCVREVPNVKATYDQLHPKGFEIVGISLDKDKTKLNDFTVEHKMEWPQFFDGLYWQNKYATQFEIRSVPSMWLVDKKGILRDIYGETGLSHKVTKLLAE
jgi:thiol-disulfide isomerase/thioredoxin